MRINLCAIKYRDVFNGNWSDMYKHVIEALHDMGHTIYKSPYLNIAQEYEYITVGLEDESPTDTYVYNHSYIKELKNSGMYRGENNLFIKPTGPTDKHFTIDRLGYACNISITYTKPHFEGYDYKEFFNTKASKWVSERQNKWYSRSDLKATPLQEDIPDNHILVLAQIPADETVSSFSFGYHWEKVKKILENLKSRSEPIVVKLHPEFSKDNLDHETLKEWKNSNIVILEGTSSLYDVLKKTKVAILENSTAGIECLIAQVPIISYGYPEYHWVTKDLRHLTELDTYLDDMSWYNKERANSFIAWYCENFMCYDKASTIRRLKQLL